MKFVKRFQWLIIAWHIAAGVFAWNPGAVAQAAESIEAYEAQIRQATEQLEQLDAELAKSRELKKSLQQALSQVSDKVGEREQRIAGLDKDVERYNNQLDKLENRVSEQRAGINARKAILAQSLRKTQRIEAGAGLKVILQHDNPAMADRLGVYTDYFMRAQQQQITEQLAALQRIEVAHQEALKNRNWLNYIKKKATAQRTAYQQSRNEKKRALGDVAAGIDSKSKTVAQLKADQQRLKQLMEELKAAQIARSGYFKSGKGRYPMPVDGVIDARFGDIKSVGKIRWNGLFIKASTGTPVRSIADGEVMYSDWLQGFGMLVIVDHGDGYMTLYGGNRDVAVSKGAWVDSGATIATVGDSGGQKTSGVYFEIRHNVKPVDPEKWLGARNGTKSAKK